MTPTARKESAHDSLVEMTLGGCRLEAVIGRGGMGTVYRAHHLALDKAVAVKVLAPFLEGDREYVARFQLEARAAAKIEHPNVVQVLNVALENGHHFIIQAFVEGESVEQILRRRKRLDAPFSTRIVRSVAAGLGALHLEGIIHRDVKPANILVGRDGGVKLTDFGLARVVAQEKGFTLPGSFMGTPEYISPEQAEGKPLDARSDLYSLGVSWFQMLSGKLPFDGTSPMDIAAKHMRDQTPNLASVLPNVEPAVARVVDRMLRKSPDDRYPDAASLINELDPVLEALPTVVRESSDAEDGPAVDLSAPTRPERASASRRAASQSRGPAGRRRVLFWALTLSGWILALLAGAMGAAHRGDEAWAGLWKILTHHDGGIVTRLPMAILACVTLVAALWMGRRAVAGLFGMAAAFCLFAGAGHAPVEGSSLGHALSVTFAEGPAAVHLGPVAIWLLASGIVLGWPRGAGRTRRIFAGFLILSAYPAVAAHSYFDALSATRRIPWGDWIPFAAGLVGLVVAVIGLRFVLGRGRVVGAILLAGAVPLFHVFGRAGAVDMPVAGPGESWTGLVHLPASWVAAQAMLTVGILLAVWTFALHRRRGAAHDQRS